MKKEKKIIEEFISLLAQKQKAKGKDINGGVFNNTVIDVIGTARLFGIKDLCGQKIDGEDAVDKIWKEILLA
ncbi:MAG: hypothetical protein L6Q29_03680 [Candidatus Pacebacteria bacterium]|nr:hypothetical protein [Candidatus Paceibacterota bacterium]NUQ57644.1 hypothetical protein [Candidatus Paceibacter sp.]